MPPERVLIIDDDRAIAALAAMWLMPMVSRLTNPLWPVSRDCRCST